MHPPPAPGTFRVAAIQYASEFGAVQANCDGLERLVREAARNGAQVIVMPEAAIPGYLSADLQTAWRDPVRRPNPKDGRSLEGIAETADGPSARRFRALAKELNVYMVATLIERAETQAPPSVNYFNTALLIGPDGAVACHYRKLHPWARGEATWAQKGDRGLGTCETSFGRLGLMICYDISCGTVEQLKDAGVKTILYPIGWVCPSANDWFDGMLPEKVRDWGVNLVGANWSVRAVPQGKDAWAGWGHSRIIAADGAVLARPKRDLGDAVLYADFPIEKN
ncbi:MAG: carbon-nitrogen hydrolase family protein [Planctomycetes bacterium]|nr:carbon-nitrogen hydrolase family protein [Planctomycetota bacterium]